MITYKEYIWGQKANKHIKNMEKILKNALITDASHEKQTIGKKPGNISDEVRNNIEGEEGNGKNTKTGEPTNRTESTIESREYVPNQEDY